YHDSTQKVMTGSGIDQANRSREPVVGANRSGMVFSKSPTNSFTKVFRQTEAFYPAEYPS
ncbi:MAG: hypothetical protein ABFC57_09580, partial [Veillonellales bacterium]